MSTFQNLCIVAAVSIGLYYAWGNWPVCILLIALSVNRMSACVHEHHRILNGIYFSSLLAIPVLLANQCAHYGPSSTETWDGTLFVRYDGTGFLWYINMCLWSFVSLYLMMGLIKAEKIHPVLAIFLSFGVLSVGLALMVVSYTVTEFYLGPVSVTVLFFAWCAICVGVCVTFSSYADAV